MSKVDIPAHWQRVEHGMSGVFIERNIKNTSGWKVLDELLDIIHVPAWGLCYEVNAGTFPTDAAIQQAINMFAHGRNIGLTMGRELERTEIRTTIYKALGIANV